MRGDVAIYAVVRVVVPQVTGSSPEEMVLSALKKVSLLSDLPPGADIVKYEISQRRPGGAEENKEILIDRDHLALLEVEMEAGAGLFDLAEQVKDAETFTSPEPPTHHPSLPVLLLN